MNEHVDPWREYRTRRNVALFAFIAYFPVVFVTAQVVDRLIQTSGPAIVVMFGWLFSDCRWVRQGTPAPRAERVGVRNGGTPQAAFVFDEFGNAVGGVRSPYLDVPAATYHAKTPGQAVCGNLVNIDPFDWARLEKLYGSHQAYVAKVGQAVDRLVQQRWLTRADGERIKRDSVAPGTSSNR